MAKKPNPLLSAVPKNDSGPQAGEGKGKASKSQVAPSRAGKKLIAGHFSPETAKAMKRLAVEDDTTVQALLGEAMELLFKKKNIKTKVE